MISVVVPVYNIATIVNYCIDSLMRQSVDNWELILVDDGSTDNSLEILNRYAQQDARIKVVSKINGGLSSARNFGIEHASGDWILFVDGDDYLADNAIEILSDLNEKENVDVIQYGYNEVSDYSHRVLCLHPESYTYETSLEKRFENLYTIGGEAASACTKLFKREIFDKIKFKEGIIHEDEEFTTRLLFEINTILYCDVKLYQYVRRENSIITSRFNRKRLDLIGIMNNRINILRSSGLSQMADKFFWKFISNLQILYFSAKSVNDKTSQKMIAMELKKQLKNVSQIPERLPFVQKVRYWCLRHNAWLLDVEAIIRSLSRHKIYG